MQITLNQNEIEKAIISYVSEQGISITGKNVSVSLTAGRGANGMTASIDISNDATVEAQVDIPTPRGTDPVEVVEEEVATADKTLFGNG